MGGMKAIRSGLPSPLPLKGAEWESSEITLAP